LGANEAEPEAEAKEPVPVIVLFAAPTLAEVPLPGWLLRLEKDRSSDCVGTFLGFLRVAAMRSTFDYALPPLTI